MKTISKIIHPSMLRRLIAIFIALTLCWTTVACSSSAPKQEVQQTSQGIRATTSNQVKSGRYPVQQATYDDGDGVYSLMLLNTPTGSPPVFRTENLQMARLTDEDIAKGEKTAAQIEGNKATLYLTEDFKIEYVHNVTETKTNPQTQQPETVVVRQQSSFWTPFAGALAGQALGSLLFRPQYYVPPAYQPGGITGYGGYGNSYNQAVERYQTKYNSPPPAVQNRQTLRTTGKLRRTASNSANLSKQSPGAAKSSGSGYGSNNLRKSGKSDSTRLKSNSGFGSSSPRRSRSFGSSRRR